MEPDGSAQVAVFVDFENLVLGAVKELPDQANPAPYEALTRLCREYGNASVRRAYADWANPLFGGHQEDLAMNGVDLIQVARVGIQNKNAADIRMAVDAMETLIVHPEVSVFILVSGCGSSASGWSESGPRRTRAASWSRCARSTSTGARWWRRSSRPHGRPQPSTSPTPSGCWYGRSRSPASRR